MTPQRRIELIISRHRNSRLRRHSGSTYTMFDHDSESAAHVELSGTDYQIPSRFQFLPDDVLGEILIACVDKCKNPTFDTKTAPMLLTQISSHIRCVALQTPQLWDAIHMEFGHRGAVEKDEWTGAVTHRKWTKMLVRHTRQQLGELRRWLIFRSGVLPLSISITERPQSHGRRGREFALEIIEILLACYRRWRDISLNFHSSNMSLITL